MPRAHKGITKSKNGTWSIDTRISINGVLKKIHLRGFKTEREAYAEKVRVVNMYKQGTLTSDTPFYFRELAESFFDDYKTTVKDTTATNRYSTFRKYFILGFEDRSIHQVVTSSSLKEFKSKLIEDNLSSDWINKLLRYMKHIIEFGYKRGWVNVDQFKLTNIELRGIYQDSSKVKERVVWSKEQFNAFLATFSTTDRNYIMFKLFMHLGCRISELRGLQVKHFDRVNKTVYICQQATSKLDGPTKLITLKTKSSIRYIDISLDTNLMLCDYIDSLALSSEDFLFFSFSPNKPIGEETIRAILRKHIKLAGVPYISPHGFRHTNTTWILSGDLSLNEIGQVSRRLGHKDKSVTLNIYFHIHEKTSEKILKNLS